MDKLISFIGFGEAGFHIANGLRLEGLDNIVAYDLNQFNGMKGETIKVRAEETGVDLLDTLEETYIQSRFVISLTNSKAAYEIARKVVPKLRKGQVFVDMNSAAPTVKEKINSINREKGVLFCDATIMETVPGRGHKVPILLSGDGAGVFQTELSKYGMDLTNLKARAGTSSAIKMFRSVFMKGLAQLMMEALVPAAKFGALDPLINSLNNSLIGKSVEDLAQLFMARTLIHARRRAAEMEDAVITLEEMGLDASISKSVQYKLEQLDTGGFAELIDQDDKLGFADVIKILIQEAERNG